ncbi:MAG: peptidylprolyl isomerase [Pseudomonadota bacterium]
MTACTKEASEAKEDTTASDVVTLQTSEGNITIELYAERVPATVANFRRYIDDGRYDGASFYRTVRDDNQAQNNILIDVIQGGLGFANLANGLAPVIHETTRDTGVMHLDGTLSLARGAPGTGSSEFFICIGAQPALDFGGMRNPDGLGFAAFGRVIDGMDVVRRIHRMPTFQPEGDTLDYTSGQILAQPVVITQATRSSYVRD